MQYILVTLFISMKFRPFTARTFHGAHGYTSYIRGNGPIIFLDQHGALNTREFTPDTIEDRSNGCLDANGDCEWIKGCSPPTADCEAKNNADTHAREIAECLHSTVYSDLFPWLTNHLISTDLHRSKLDSNREIQEAAMGDSAAEIAWMEIHLDFGKAWIKQSKDMALDRCGWAVLFDIHGQSVNDYVHFSYRATANDLEKSDRELNAATVTEKSSIYGLIRDTNADYAQVIRGPKSLGSLLELKSQNGNNYETIPSQTVTKKPSHLDNFKYYTGGFAAKYHGSSRVNELESNEISNAWPDFKSMTSVDVIQIEVPYNIRFEKNQWKRAVFCKHLSSAIEDFINEWYPIDDCQGGQEQQSVSSGDSGHGVRRGRSSSNSRD